MNRNPGKLKEISHGRNHNYNQILNAQDYANLNSNALGRIKKQGLQKLQQHAVSVKIQAKSDINQ